MLPSTLALIFVTLFYVVLLLSYGALRTLSAHKPHGLTCEKIVAIGDLHGDRNHTLRIMQAAKLVSMDTDLKWIAGGDVCVVQTGDIVDYGPDNLFPLFDRWREESGGRLINLLGNHEIWNLDGDFRYVPKEDIDNWKGGYQGRLDAWQGEFGAKIIENFRAAYLQDRNLFVHAGLLPKFTHHGDITKLVGVVREKLLDAHVKKQQASDDYFVDGGPFFTDAFLVGAKISWKGWKAANACPLLAETLSIVSADRMIVGHTPVKGGINSYCGGRLLAIDTSISSYEYPMCWGDEAKKSGCVGLATFLEIKDGKAYENIVNMDSKLPEIFSRKHLVLDGEGKDGGSWQWWKWLVLVGVPVIAIAFVGREVYSFVFGAKPRDDEEEPLLK